MLRTGARTDKVECRTIGAPDMHRGTGDGSMMVLEDEGEFGRAMSARDGAEKWSAADVGLDVDYIFRIR